MPIEVQFAISQNGIDFEILGSVKNDVSPKAVGGIIKNFSFKTKRKARYIRVTAINRRVCPDFHKGAGGKAWIFADEIWIK